MARVECGQQTGGNLPEPRQRSEDQVPPNPNRKVVMSDEELAMYARYPLEEIQKADLIIVNGKIIKNRQGDKGFHFYSEKKVMFYPGPADLRPSESQNG